MTVINHKNISGITSITTPAGSDNLFTVHTNDTTERFRIDASGAVFTGVVTATSLNVNGSVDSIKASNNYILIGSSNAGGASLVLDGDSNGDGGGTDYAYIEHDTSGNLNIVGDNPANAANIIFKTNSSTERLRIKSDGNIGIGTNTATSKLEIFSPPLNATTVNTTTCKQLGLWINPSGTGDNTTGNIYNGIALSDGFAGLYGYDAGASAATGLGFFTGNASAVAERLRITSAGKFGFNDDNPERTIDVKGSNCMIQLEGTGGNGRQYSLCSTDDVTGAAVGSAGQFVIYDDTSGTARLNITSDGKVLAGGLTATTGGMLAVQGGQAYASSANSLATSVTKAAFRVKGSTNSSDSLWMGVETTGANPYIQGNNDAGNNAKDVLLNPFGGRIIIGDTDNANAHANADDLIIGNTGSDQRSGITIVSDTDKDGAIHFSDGAGAGQLRGQIVYGHTFGSYSDVLAMYTAGSSSMLIQSDGDVVLGEIGGTRYTEGSTEAQLRVVGDASAGRPGAISLMGFGNTTNAAHARINFQQQTTGSNGQTTARIEAINRSGGEDASDLVFYTEKTGQNLTECARMTTRGELLINRTDAVSTNLSFDSLHLGIGGNYGPNLSYRTIGFGYRTNETSEYPASIGCQITDWASNTKAELVFATRNTTGQADVATERLRITSGGDVVVGGTSVGQAGSFGMQQSGHVRTVLASGGGAGDTLFGAISGVSNGFQINVDSSNNQEYRFHNGSSRTVSIKSNGVTEFGSNGNWGANPRTVSIGSRTQNIFAPLAIARGEAIGGGTGPLMEFIHGPDGGTQRIHQLYSYVGDFRIFADTSENLELRGTQIILKDNGDNVKLRVKNVEIDTEDNTGINVYGGGINHTNDSVIYSHKTNNSDWCIQAASPGNDYGIYSRVGNGAAYAIGVYDSNNSSWRFRIRGDGVIFAANTTIQSISDQRLKENIVDANSQWNDIKALRFRNFNWKADSGYNDGKTILGLIAQEVEPISPNLIEIDAQTKEDIENGVPDPEYKSVKYSVVWMKAVKALQEAQARIETLEAKVAALEGS